MRGATDRKCYIMELSEVSTHAPHARCDGVSRAAVQKALSFYSRTSCEVRLGGLSRNGLSLVFLLTHLMRGATTTTMNYPTASKKFLLTHLMRGATSS